LPTCSSGSASRGGAPRAALWSALALSLAYLAMATLLGPLLWIDPLGALLKVWLVLAPNLLLLAILEEY
jgi:hypothetical protein